MPRADAAQIRALVAANRRPDDRRSAMAVRADPDWPGPELLDGLGEALRVVGCRSPLAVREALLDQEQRSGELLVLLTLCTGADLGLDVRARLVKGEVLPLDSFSSVLALFRATVLDPQLVDERWLIDELIALAPPGGWVGRQPLGGVLDADLAWRTWQDARLGISDLTAGLPAILAMGSRPEIGVALAELGAERRAQIAQRWAGGVPGPILVLVELIAGGHGGDLDALGLVADVLWAATNDPGLASRQTVARARLEALLGRDRVDQAAAASWGEAAEASLVGHPNQPAVLDAAERVLADAGASELAVLSEMLPRGFDERLSVLGNALTAGDLATAVSALEDVSRHRQTRRRPHRVEMAEAAVRLLRRSQLPGRPVPTSFAGAAADYAADGAWLDEARQLLADGDQVPALATAYTGLCETAAAERAAGTARFAELLAEWSQAEPQPDARIVPLEQLLTTIAGPVAVAAPVLLVVCDGMSLAVTHALARDLMAEGWAPAAEGDGEGWPVGVAALPTVTEASRTTLLCGHRTIGGQAEERAGFSAHPALRAASAAARPPRLFHQADLIGPSGVALPEPLRALVAEPDQRVVGVVVNAVDDHLARGHQLRIGWDLSSLRPLSWLLDAAAEAGRVLILTSDHGHVLDSGRGRYRPLDGVGGERWRATPPGPGDGEIEVAGPRVLLGGGRVVLPTDDRLRYGVPKHGYHGGATPEEVLVPVEVLARRLPPGWVHRPVHSPGWWSGEPTAAAAPAPGPAPLAPGRKVKARDQPSLFAPTPGVAPGPTGGGWVAALLANPTFAANRQRARLPRPMPEERLRRYLDLIDGNGGTIPLAALSARTGEPPDTLRMALTLVQRLVNLDGAEILAVRADGTVAINRELATLQFDLDVP